MPVLLLLCEEVRGGGAIGGPALDAMAAAGELWFEDGGAVARGVIVAELDSAGDGWVGVWGEEPLFVRAVLREEVLAGAALGW